VAPDGTTPLHDAVRRGEFARVEALIKGGANVNATTRYGVSPISLAALNGDAKVVELLLGHGANANATSGEGETVLMLAARAGNPAVVKALLDHGAAVNAKEGWYEQTALMWAAGENHADVVPLLARAGADLSARTVVNKGRGGVGIATTTPGGLTALIFAVRDGAAAAAAALLDAGADVNLADPNGSTPLVYALLNGHFDLAVMLIERGADPNRCDTTGRGPLYVAVDMHSLEFLFNRPSPKLVDTHTSRELVEMLLAHGADVNQELTNTILPPKAFATGNSNLTAGSTPFLKAASTSDVEMMKLLLEWGANPFQTNKTGANALMMSAGLAWKVPWSRGSQEEAIEAAKLLLDLGLDIHAADESGQTALHGAAMRTEQDATKLIQYLVDAGANLYARTKAGRTPLDESGGEDNKTAADVRRGNDQSRELLQALMKTHPDPAKGLASTGR
jgi:ankyrin repeat protein